MSFLEHLDHLRWHLVRAVSCVLIVSIVVFFFKSVLFDDILFAPSKSDFVTYKLYCWFANKIKESSELCFQNLSFDLININMSGQFMLHLKGSFIAGLIISFPYVIFELLRFIFPGLKNKEKKSTLFFSFVSSFLFFVGALFGYFILAPLSIQFLGNYSVSGLVENKITVSSFIATLSLIVLSSGVAFQLPLVVYFLAKMSLITAAFLKKYMKHAIVVILALSAMITPPDITSQILLAIPVFILYYISIFIAKRVDSDKE